MNAVLYLNIIVAVSTGVLSGGIAHMYREELWWAYAIFATTSTFAVYNGQRVFKAKSAIQTPWIAWVRRHQNSVLLTTFVSGCIAVGIHVMYLPITFLGTALLGVTAVISAFYVVKIGGVNMREIPHLKIHLISLSWSIVLIVFPLLGNISLWSVVVIGVAHYLYVLGVTIPFDIRDIKYDKKQQKTIPQQIGVTGARILSLFCLFSFSVVLLYFIPDLWMNPLFYLAVLVQMALALGMNEARGDLYCAGLIDGAITLLGVSYFFT